MISVNIYPIDPLPAIFLPIRPLIAGAISFIMFLENERIESVESGELVVSVQAVKADVGIYSTL